ncbi:hypothetical protein RRG08_056929 [Elysia crispata]|uniref:Uncharacterized protein n=1 Tax=Elysia crispata TaxID=231223 RepID=A0AAE1D0G1_9GAST|nr:hypothetical protein RRG08_056929 [Elysia crispata]
MGGVFLPDPFQQFKDFETLMGLPYGIVSKVLVKGWVDGPWGRMMTGQMTVPEFARVFCQLLSKEINREIQEDTVVAFMSSYGNAQAYPEMLAAARSVRAEGLRTALLTNNCYLDEGRTRTLLPLERSLFDVVVESCVLGYCKPDRRVYNECLHRLDVTPDQTIFLDDQTDNVEVARSIGITSIKVNSPSQAVAELSRILDIPLNYQPSCTDTNPIMSNWGSELVMDAKTAASKLACSENSNNLSIEKSELTQSYTEAAISPKKAKQSQGSSGKNCS